MRAARPRPGRRALRPYAGWPVFPVVLAAGCVATQPIPPAEAPAYGTIAGAHNARLERLRTIYSRGVIEIRWSDETGRHFEQGNVDLWVALPRHTALRVEKLGEVLLWLGSDDDHYWLFDRFGEETTLVVGRHEDAPRPVHATALTVRPLSLLDLMGLTPLPDGAAVDIVYDADRDAWALETVGAGGPIRLYLDRTKLLPKRVEVLSEKGEVTLYSDLGRYKSVKLAGAAGMANPKLATIVDVAATNDSARLKLALDSPTDDANPPVFRLERLIRALQPDRIEGTLPDGVEVQGSGFGVRKRRRGPGNFISPNPEP